MVQSTRDALQVVPYPIVWFSVKNMTMLGGALKWSKLKAISHSFRRNRDSCTKCHGMPRGYMR